MGRYGCMKPRYDFIQYLLLQAHLFIIICSLKAILFVYQWPDIWSIITRKRLYVCAHIEILTLIILLILYMPHPFIRCWISFLSPHIFSSFCTFHFVCRYPILRNIFLITSANWTAFRFAKFIHIRYRAFGVQV